MVVNHIREVIRRRQAEDPVRFSPKAIAERMHVHLVTIYKWESGDSRPSTGKLAQLARDLHVPMGDLLEYLPDNPWASLLEDPVASSA